MTKITEQKSVIWVLIIIIAVTALVLSLNSDSSSTATKVTETTQTASSTQNFGFMTPAEWPGTSRALAAIQSLTPEQTFDFGIVADPQNTDLYYFEATSPDAKFPSRRLHSFYAYNNQDYTFERIYRLTLGPVLEFDGLSSDAIVDLHVIGVDADKLIVLAQNADTSPGPCTEVLTLGREADDQDYEMLSLDLLDPYQTGLQPYSVPEEIYSKALEKQSNCVIN